MFVEDLHMFENIHLTVEGMYKRHVDAKPVNKIQEINDCV